MQCETLWYIVQIKTSRQKYGSSLWHQSLASSKSNPTLITGWMVQKAYPSLGTSCHNEYTRYQLLLAHATIGICCMHCDRKHLNWCMPFVVGWPPTWKINFNGTANITKFLCRLWRFTTYIKVLCRESPWFLPCHSTFLLRLFFEVGQPAIGPLIQPVWYLLFILFSMKIFWTWRNYIHWAAVWLRFQFMLQWM